MIYIDCKACGKRHQVGTCEGKPVKTPEALRAAYNEYQKLYMRKRRGGLKRKPK